MGSAVLGVAIVIALLVIRTAVHELRVPGSGARQWAFLGEPRALAVGAFAGLLLGAIGWASIGPASMPWAVLAGLLVAGLAARP
ncbi:hypothetical protein [Streptomyces sp. NBC_01353]|uniref:hypothetical protein n=1 Tax=Streptomyces sp. NBC_01353 TaxID=2903835 RepID=UPI002E379218|nr:hypothetical protein [Streptomyces sp. NBC_01353]